MTGKDMYYSLGSIDEKWLKEAEDYKCEGKVKKYTAVKIIIPAAACLAITAAAVTVLNNKPSTEPVTTPAVYQEDSVAAAMPEIATEGSDTAHDVIVPGITDSTEADGVVEVFTENSSSAGSDITVPSVEPTTVISSEPYSGDGSSTGGFFIPCTPLAGSTVIANGQRITDEEAKEYFAKTKGSLTSALSASGVDTANMRIAEHGYSHISFDGTEGEHYIIKENFRNYLVWSDDKLIAIVTLIKENDVITDCPAFGGTWFDAYNDFLNAHKNEELTFFYAANKELIVTPDNTVYAPVLTPHGYNAEEYFPGLKNGQLLPTHPSAIYVP